MSDELIYTQAEMDAEIDRVRGNYSGPLEQAYDYAREIEKENVLLRGLLASLDEKQQMFNLELRKGLWFKCSKCEKERQVRYWGDDDERVTEAYERLMKHVICNSCSQVYNFYSDNCPETVWDSGGIGGCKLGFRHKGRCEPMIEATEWKEVLTRLKTEPFTRYQDSQSAKFQQDIDKRNEES